MPVSLLYLRSRQLSQRITVFLDCISAEFAAKDSQFRAEAD